MDKYITGESSNSNFQEAIEDALSKAKTNSDGPIFFNWELNKVYGQIGGVVNAKKLWVEIKVSR